LRLAEKVKLTGYCLTWQIMMLHVIVKGLMWLQVI